MHKTRTVRIKKHALYDAGNHPYLFTGDPSSQHRTCRRPISSPSVYSELKTVIRIVYCHTFSKISFLLSKEPFGTPKKYDMKETVRFIYPSIY